MVTRTAHCAQQGVLGCEARREGKPALAALQGGQALFERLASGVAGPAVFVALAGSADRVLQIGCGGKDGRHDGTCERFGILAGVNGECLEAVGHAAKAT